MKLLSSFWCGYVWFLFLWLPYYRCTIHLYSTLWRLCTSLAFWQWCSWLKVIRVQHVTFLGDEHLRLPVHKHLVISRGSASQVHTVSSVSPTNHSETAEQPEYRWKNTPKQPKKLCFFQRSWNWQFRWRAWATVEELTTCLLVIFSLPALCSHVCCYMHKWNSTVRLILCVIL